MLAQLKASKEEIGSLRDQIEKLIKDNKDKDDKLENWKDQVEVLEEEIFDLESLLKRLDPSYGKPHHRRNPYNSPSN